MARLLEGRFTAPDNLRFANHLRRHQSELFVFLDREDVEATGRRPAPEGSALTAGRERRGSGRQAGRAGPGEGFVPGIRDCLLSR
jgi:hypothetical protein